MAALRGRRRSYIFICNNFRQKRATSAEQKLQLQVPHRSLYGTHESRMGLFTVLSASFFPSLRNFQSHFLLITALALTRQLHVYGAFAMLITFPVQVGI